MRIDDDYKTPYCVRNINRIWAALCERRLNNKRSLVWLLHRVHLTDEEAALVRANCPWYHGVI